MSFNVKKFSLFSALSLLASAPHFICSGDGTAFLTNNFLTNLSCFKTKQRSLQLAFFKRSTTLHVLMSSCFSLFTTQAVAFGCRSLFLNVMYLVKLKTYLIPANLIFLTDCKYTVYITVAYNDPFSWVFIYCKSFSCFEGSAPPDQTLNR